MFYLIYSLHKYIEDRCLYLVYNTLPRRLSGTEKAVKVSRCFSRRKRAEVILLTLQQLLLAEDVRSADSMVVLIIHFSHCSTVQQLKSSTIQQFISGQRSGVE